MSIAFARSARRAGLPPSSKVTLGARYVRSVNPWSQIAVLEADIATLTPGTFAQIDAAVCSFDNLRARFLAARLLLAARVPFADVGALAEHGLARVSVADPARTSGDRPDAQPACPICPWSAEQLARSGEDVGLSCAGVELDTGAGASSTLTVGHRAASLAVRETLALCGVIRRVAPSVGRELRDDLYGLRTESFVVRLDPHCAADHALHAPAEALGLAPGELRLGELARACGLHAEDTIVLATSELVHTGVCTSCWTTAQPFRRVGTPRLPCPACGAPLAPLRRTRRVSWGEAAASVRHASAAEWFVPGDAFAVEARDGARAYRFPAPPLAWQAGAPWSEALARERYKRLPADHDLGAIRRKRIALLGLGHVGSAVLQQLAPLPFAGFLIQDRDRIAVHNLASFALPVEDATS